MQQSGLQDLLKYGSDYDKLIASVNLGGARNVLGAGSLQQQAAKAGPGAGDFLNLAKMLMPGADKTAAGTLGGTRGARTSTSGDDSGLGSFDHRYNYLMTNDPMKGAGGEAAPFGGAARYFGSDVSDRALNPLAVLDYGDAFGKGNALDYSGGYYRTPWTF